MRRHLPAQGAEGFNPSTSSFSMDKCSIGKSFQIVLAICSFMFLATSGYGQNVNVNPGAGSYATLKDAFDAINLGTHTGAITIDIINNTTESATAALNASGAGAASYTNILIQPSGGAARTISGAIAAGSPLIEFNGADNVTVDGLNTGGNALTISNTTVSSTSGTSTIRFQTDASSNTIIRCTVLGSATMANATAGGNIIFGSAAISTGNDNNTISNCNLGPAGANLPSKCIYFSGTSNTDPGTANSGIVITNNNIFDFFSPTLASSGIDLNSGTVGTTISNNRFYQTATRTQTTGAGHRAISINNSSGNAYQITGNIIGYANSAGSGAYTIVLPSGGNFIPILLTVNTATASSVQGNTIAGIAISGASSGTSSSAPFRGIYVSSGLTTIGDVTGNTIGSSSATGSITYTSSSTSTSDVMAMFNFGSSNWTVNNNTIGGISVANSSTGAGNLYGIRLNTSSSAVTTIQGNTIGGIVANSLQSTSTATGSQVAGIFISTSLATVSNNTIRNLSASGGTGAATSASVLGIGFVSTGVNNTVTQNTIYNLSNSNTTVATIVTGIQYTASSGANLVARNLIYGLTSSTTSATAEINGIRVAGGTTTYRNNMIAIGAGVSNAILVSGINEPSGTDNFFHNSVFIDGAPTAGSASSFAFNSAQTTNTRSFRDNIFVNARSNSGATGKNYAVRVGGAVPNPPGLTINNNIYYANGSGAVFGLFNTVDVPDLTAWRAAVGQDVGSFYGDPKYLDPTNATPDLHLSTVLTTVAEGNGADVGVTDDYDGQTRSGLTPVDIGADAGNFMGVDLALPVITYSQIANTSCFTDRDLSATITDASGINALAGTKPRLYFKKSTDTNTFGGNTSADNGWKFVEATNASSPFTFTTNYTLLQSAVVTADIIQYFVVAQDLAPTPNVGINSGSFNSTPTSVALVAGNFPIGGTINSYTIVATLSGTVTVGAAGTYTSLTGATGLFNAINTTGISGALTVELIDASIAETGATVLNAINYSGCAAGPYNLTIKPASGVNTTLTGSVATGALIKLNGADNVTIDGSNNGSSSRNLTITNTNTATSGNAVLWLAAPAAANGSNNNTIKNCIIEGNASTTTLIGIYVGGNTTISTTAAGLENNNNNTIQNNLFRKSQYGLAFFGYAAPTPDNNNMIINNTFGTAMAGEGFQLAGINADRQNNMVVSGNEVQNVKGTSATAMYGIRLLDFKSGQAFKNNVHNLNYSGTSASARLYGFAVASSSYTTAGNPSQAQIYNNLVYDITTSATSSTWNMTGMLAGGGYGDKYYFNTIHLTGQLNNSASGLTAAFANGDENTTAFGTNLDVRNNIFNVAGTSLGGNVWAYYSKATSLAGTTQNNNVLRCAGTGATNNTARLNGINYTTLATWQAASGVDAASIEADPLMNSNTNLIPGPGSPTLAAGATGTGITTDYLGATRGATPTIGAYEQVGDFAAPVINYAAFTSTACTINPVLSATITDASGVNTTAGTKPRLYFKKSTNANTYIGNTSGDDGWKYVEATNATSPFSFTMDYSLLQAPVAAGDIIQYFVVAEDLVMSPNVGVNTGTFTINPSTVALIAANFPLTGMSSYTILNPGLTGTVTIGAMGTYTSLTEAGGLFSEINTKGLAGNLLAEIVDATLTENGANALNAMLSTACSGGPFTLTIKPTGTTTISGSSTGAIIRINGADNVIIDGSIGATGNTVCPPSAASRNLTIVNTNAGTSSAVVWLQANGTDGATNNTVKNCIITGNSNTTTLFGLGSGSSTIGTTSLGNGNNNNSFVNNSISKTQYGIYTQGASVANKNSGNTINQNVINAASPNHVGKGGIWTGFENNLTISGNVVENMTNTADLFAISLGIGNSFANSTTSGNEVTNATVTKNVINSISNTGTNSAAGIMVASATTGTNTIANNMIGGVSANGTVSDFCTGILLGGGTGSTTNVYFNTVATNGTITGSTAGVTQSFALAVTNATAPTLDIRNNILVNSQLPNAGGTTKFYAIGLAYSSTTGNYTGLTSNNNDLYAITGANYALGITGSLSAGTSRANLAAWQAETGRDGASVSLLPVFISATNLHVDPINADNFPLDNAAVAISITDDIDCETRMTDIGADEFVPPPCTAATGGTAAITGPSTFCASGTPVITATGYSVGTGSGYQWISSTSFGDYPAAGSPVMGQTNPATLITGVVSTTTYYWLRVTCATGMSTDNSTLVTVTITPAPTATLSPAGTVNICPPTSSQLLTSSTNASSPTYVWKKDGVVIGGETNPTYTATTTGGYTVVITDGTTMCSNTSATSLVTFGVTPVQPVISPSSVAMCGNDPAALLTASGSIDVGSTTSSSGAISLAIPDVSATGINHSLTVAGIPGGSTIDSVIVTFNITHNFDEDIIVNLEAPNGQIVNLVKGTIISTGANFVNTRASSDTGKPAFPGTGAPFTSTYTADLGTTGFQLTPSPVPTTGTFSSLYTAPNGTWKIRVYDDESIGTGTFTGWSIKVNYNSPAAYTWSPNGIGSGLYTDAGATTLYTGTATPTVYAKPAATETYTVTATNSGGCTNTQTVMVTVNPAPTITLGMNPSVCSGITMADLPYSGTTESPDQYSIDYNMAAEVQGFVDATNIALPVSPIVLTVPGGATPGAYGATLTVRNSTTGCFSSSSPVTVTILPLPDAGTVSGTSPLCVGNTATYTSTGDPGGTWSSSDPTKASVNAVSGLVTALEGGMTSIKYTVSNACGSPSESSLTLTVDSIVVSNNGDIGTGSLRDIIACAVDGATITFEAGLSGQTILLTTGEIVINKNITLVGLGALNLTLSGGGTSRIFHVLPGYTLTLEGMSLINGASMTNGGAIYAEGNLNLNNLILQNNTENGAPKSLTAGPASIVEIIGNVDFRL